MFEVAVEDARRLLHVRVQGFWDAETMAAYSRAVREAMAGLQRSGGCKAILIDMTGYPIQTAPIAEAHGAMLRTAKAMPGVRIALVMQSALSKIQASRLADDAGHKSFSTEESARAWLFAGD